MSKPITIQDAYNSVYNRRSINEDVEIFSQEPYEDTPKSIGTVEDKYYDVLRRQIIARQKGGTTDITHAILHSCDWDSGGNKREYEKNVLIPAIDIINNTTDVDLEAYQRFAENKASYTWLADSLSTGEEFNIKSGCTEVMSQFFNNSETVFDYLYNHSFALQTVGVGKGELVMTMFSNAVKGIRGDLDVPGVGEVEVKGKNGRPGKGKNALNAISELPKFIQNKASRNVYSGKEIRTARDRVFQAYNSNQDSLVQFTRGAINMVKIKDEQTDTDILENIVQIADRIITSAIYDNNLEVIAADINELESLKIEADFYRKNISSRISKFIKAVNYYVEVIAGLNPKEYSATWNDIVQNTFTIPWGLDKESYIEGLMYLVNEDLPNKVIDQYKKALNSLLSPEMMRGILSNDTSNDLKYIIATIHSVSYQMVHKFPVLLFVNELNFNVYPVTFKSDDPYTNFIDVFNQYKNNSFNITLALDSQRASGIPITYIG